MWINKKKWEKLKKEKEELAFKIGCKEDTISEMRDEVTKLRALLKEAEKINNAKANDNGCRAGEWCGECCYGKKMSYDLSYRTRMCGALKEVSSVRYFNYREGYYCTKHITEICPEFEKK